MQWPELPGDLRSSFLHWLRFRLCGCYRFDSAPAGLAPQNLLMKLYGLTADALVLEF